MTLRPQAQAVGSTTGQGYGPARYLRALSQRNPRSATRRKATEVGAYGTIRTCGLHLRRVALYPAELRVHLKFAWPDRPMRVTGSAFTNQSYIAAIERLRPAIRCSAVLRKLLTPCLRENVSGFGCACMITQPTVFTNISSVTQARNTLDISLQGRPQNGQLPCVSAMRTRSPDTAILVRSNRQPRRSASSAIPAR